MRNMASIQIKWLGHSCFRVECEDYAIVLDPFEPGSVARAIKPILKTLAETDDLALQN